MKLLACASSVGSTIAEIRLGLPLRRLAAERGWPLVLRDLWDVGPDDLETADVLILQRPISPPALRLVRRMQASGGRVVCEFDDLLTAPAPHLLGFENAQRLVPRVQQALAAADLVTAATPRLADALRPLARRVALVPNYAWPGVLPPPAMTGGVVHLLLAASDRLAGGPLLQALAEVLAARPDGVVLVAVGPAAEVLAQAGLPHRAEPLMPREAFLRFAGALPQALAVIPLGRTPFDACKSAIKWFDYAVAGVPVLCSAVPPYADVVTDGVDGRLVADDVAAWRDALLQAIDEPGRARAWAQAAHATVQARHTLAHTTAAWAAALDALGPRCEPVRRLPTWLRAWDAGVARLHGWNRRRLAARRTLR